MPSAGSAALLRLVADSVPAQMAYYDKATLQCRFANRRYAEANGWTPESILGQPLPTVVGEAVARFIEPQVAQVLRGQPVHYAREQVLPDGSRRRVEVDLIPHFADDGTQIGSFVLLMDVTEQWRSTQAVRDSEERMRKFAEATSEGILFHKDGVILDANEALLRLSGYSMDELVGHQTVEFVPDKWKQEMLENQRLGRDVIYEAEIIHKSGTTVSVEMIAKSMPRDGAAYRMTVVRDITARKQAQDRIEFLAWHDPLTQLPNRLYLNEYLDKTLALARRQRGSLAVLFIDLDDFKQVNDTLGHQAGDALLCEIARRLRAAVRQADLVARLGGDEFLVVLTDIADPRNVARVATTLLESLRAYVTLDGRQVSVTPSIGISLFPEDGGTADELVSRADAAMYRVKTDGGSFYRFFSGRAPEGGPG